MKKRKLLAALLALLLLAGCAKEEEGPMLGSQRWETPQLTYGVMEYDKLDVLPWASGRCEATSFETMAETKLGYYFIKTNMLTYADKVNLSNWVPVCNKANCSHSSMMNWSYGQIVCNSEVESSHFFIRDGRIWSLWSPKGSDYDGMGYFTVLMSMNPDGTDRRIEARLESGAATPRVAQWGVSSRDILYEEVAMETDGRFTAHTYRLVGDRLEAFASLDPIDENDPRIPGLKTGEHTQIYGDPIQYSAVITGSDTGFVRVDGDWEDVIELGDTPAAGAYLSGEILRFFDTNDGYYDMNLQTGEKIKLAQCQLENSEAALILPNCILESTLLARRSLDTRAPGQTHGMKIFDGETWRSVELPGELAVTDSIFLRLKCVSSDSVWLFAYDNGPDSSEKYGYIRSDTNVYRIDLTQEQWKLEYVTMFQGYIT